MSQGTETALQALEKSTDDPLHLLNQAALIARVVYSQATHSYSTSNSRDQETSGSSFREQWLLKWLLKKINVSIEALRRDQNDETCTRLLLNEKTWAYLLYLLESISSEDLLDILIERRFSQLLLYAGQNIHLHHNAIPDSSFDDSQSQSTISDGFTDRPRKKQRLESSFVSASSTSIAILFSFLKVARKFSNLIIQGSADSQYSTVPTARKSSPAWASSITEAAEVVGCVLNIVGTIYKENPQESFDFLENTSLQWLDTWRDVSVKSADKTTVDKSFCRSCLVPSLILLTSVKSSHYISAANDLQKGLERQVARHAVLPIRSVFNRTLANSWKAINDQITWDHIGPVYGCIKSHLEGALVTETVIGVPFISFQTPDFAAELLSVASRLIPMHNLRKRQWEQPWLEAFTLGLLYLAFPRHIPRLLASPDKILEVENTDLPQNDIEAWPDQILTTILSQRIVLSSQAAVYLYRSITLRREQLVPAFLLGQLVEINSEIFTPHASNPNYSQCLDSLVASIDEREIISRSDYANLIQNVLLPLIRTYARVRELERFIELWQSQLQVALRPDNSNDNFPNFVNSGLIWCDEDLFSEFESLLAAYTVQNFAQKMLGVIAIELSHIQQRMGPTIDIFSRMAIFNSVLRARGQDLITSDLFQTELRDLVVHVANSLMQQTDYEGQRWSLWATLDAIQALDPALVSATTLIPLLESQLPYSKIKDLAQIDKRDGGDQKNTLAECLYFFSTAINFGSNEHETSKSIVQKALDHLDDMLQFYTDSLRSKNSGKVSRWKAMTWDGHLSTMTTGHALLCGYLGVLAKKPGAVKIIRSSPVFDKIRAFAYHAPKSIRQDGAPGSLAQLAQALVFISEDEIGQLALEQYATVFAADTDLSVSEKLASLPNHGLSKSMASLFATSIVSRISKLLKSKSMPVEDLVASLDLLTRIIRDGRVGIDQSFQSLLNPAVADWIVKLRRNEKVVLLQDRRNNGNNVITVCVIADTFGDLWTQMLAKQAVDAAFKPSDEIIAWCKILVAKVESNAITPEEFILLDTMLDLDLSTVSHASHWKSVTRYRKKYFNALPKCSILENERNFIRELLQRKSGALSKLFWCDENDGQATTLPGSRSSYDAVMSKIRPERLNVAQVLEPATPNSDDYYAKVCDLQSQILKADEFCRNVQLDTTASTTKSILHLESHSDRTWPLLTLVRIVSTVTEHDVDKDPALGSIFESMATLGSVIKETSNFGILLRLELSNTVLNLHPSTISQSTIDTLLSSMSLLTTSNGPQLDRDPKTNMIESDKGTTSVYDRILGLVVTLLSRHRRRLNGRSHLLIQLLRNLMRCLFYTHDISYVHQNPATTKQKQAFRSSLPAWLREGPALPQSSAAKLSRILSSICNPTTASARSAQRSKRKEAQPLVQLNDETQKAKRIAAQYMQYLLIEFARCTLDGVISAEARDRLTPGLYDVLGCLDRELMRAMNAAMDPSSRAMFKGLYDDWTKFGKWDQT